MAFRSLILLIFFLINGSELLAASCCGGGAGLPNLITGDYNAQFSFNASNSAVTYNANERSEISKSGPNGQEVSEVFTISGAYLLSPMWQIGLRLPYKFNNRKTLSNHESSSGVGDIKFQAAYEFMPEYSFSYWKPRGFLFIEQSIPTSRSVYNSRKSLRTDSMGSGFLTTSVGVSFVKVISNYDFVFMGEYHKGVKKDFDDSGKNFSVKPGDGHSLLLSAGISPYAGNWRIGGSLLYSKKNGDKITGNLETSGESSYFWEMGLSLSYLMNETYSIVASYSDQSFLGKAKNTSLNQSLSLSLIKFSEL